MMSQHSNSLTTATAAILVHNENLLRLCTIIVAVWQKDACKRSIGRGGLISGEAIPQSGLNTGVTTFQGKQYPRVA